jgi:hypothetical protein
MAARDFVHGIVLKVRKAGSQEYSTPTTGIDCSWLFLLPAPPRLTSV